MSVIEFAASRNNDRGGAQALLSEADMAATQLGLDANDRWTGFGPTNVQLHPVHVALTLGDAGAAIDYARKINPKAIHLAERKACLLTDVAQAHLQWGKASAALVALERALPGGARRSQPAPHRRRICQGFMAAAQGPVRDRTMAFAVSAGLA